ncbi:16S rRNA (cytosine(1402)-N(4))-methyltransferase RsmH [Patescibacteria group bacterium]
MANLKHTPVLLKEVIQHLNLKPNQNCIDCTVGYGGHTGKILEQIAPEGKLLGIDQDKNAISYTKRKYSSTGNRLILICDNFRSLKNIALSQNFSDYSGILFDLGVSSPQITDPGRGFSFLKEGELDMRMSSSLGESSPRSKKIYRSLERLEYYVEENPNTISAKEIVNNLPEKELANLFFQYGEEKNSRRIAKKIVIERRKKSIKTTKELAEIVSSAQKRVSPRAKSRGKIHPATRVFQALRIVVNQELESLKKGLKQAVEILEPGGRVVVISFHSLEDRIVKEFFKHQAKDCVCPPDFPECRCDKKSTLKIITKKPIIASEKEIEINPLSRSAKMRVAEKL